jgi:hypothetical protein
MVALLLAALFLAPFWEERPPAEWTDPELQLFLRSSPWAVIDKARVGDEGNSPDPGVRMFLAAASPMRAAEAEWRKRNPPDASDAEDQYAGEFFDFIDANPGKYIALAVEVLRPQLLENKREVAEMEKRCVLKVGTRKHKLVGHFLPSPADRYLRLIFPRDVNAQDERLEFELYLPGVPLPYREVTFELKRLLYKGIPEL